MPGGVLTSRDAPSFEVHLDVFTGPFDLLLGLIAKHRLDITEVALAAVTDEFIAHLRRASQGEDAGAAEHLGQASGFLLVAATLLDLKAARLLPAAEVEDAEDVALLEARDLLFARLLQHRAYAQVAAVLGERLADEARRVPRSVPPEPHLAAALPELVLATTPHQLAALAAAALSPRPRAPGVTTEHLHAPAVSVPEQVALLEQRLRRRGAATFAELVAAEDAGDGARAGGGDGGAGAGAALVVGRFLAVLELYRRGRVQLVQPEPLGQLLVRWDPDPDAGVASPPPPAVLP
ncbi:condensin subunit ScpA [Quadrisphaera sp. DSM 44207]|nr:condensin subunit ScpA [Quadrisphaera sp. DSM 44207]